MPRAKPEQETRLLTSTADKSRSRESRFVAEAGVKDEKSNLVAGTNGTMEANELPRAKRSALVNAENTEFEVAGANGAMEANGFKEEIVD